MGLFDLPELPIEQMPHGSVSQYSRWKNEVLPGRPWTMDAFQEVADRMKPGGVWHVHHPPCVSIFSENPCECCGGPLGVGDPYACDACSRLICSACREFDEGLSVCRPCYGPTAVEVTERVIDSIKRKRGDHC